MAPLDAWIQLAIGVQTGHLRARPCSTGRAVERRAGTEDKVTAGVHRVRRGAEQFDVVDGRAVFSYDAALRKCRTDSGRQFNQDVAMGWLQVVSVILHKEEPVAAPGNIAVKDTVAGHLYLNIRTETITGHILYRYAAVGMKLRLHRPDRSLEDV